MADLMNTGHYAIYGSAGTGKTFMLKTILLGLGMFYTPKDVKITVIDAANWSMSEFSDMPHVSEVILNREKDKIENFIVKMRRELETRRAAFLRQAVNSLKAYRETVSADMPAIIIAIDNIRPLFEEYYELQLVMDELAASGAAFGIYIIFTTNSSLGISYKFSQLIKGAISFQMPEKGDYTSVVGPIANVSLPAFPGRALMKADVPIAFQAAMYAESSDDKQRHNELAEIFVQMKNAWTGTPKQSSEESNVSSGAEAEPKIEYIVRSRIPIGCNVNDLEPVCVDMFAHNLLLISSDNRDKNSQLLGRVETVLSGMPDNKIIRPDAGNYEEELGFLESLLNDRKKNCSLHKKEEGFDAEKWAEDFVQICIIIDDLKSFAEKLPEKALTAYRRIFTKTSELGVIILAAGLREELSSSEPDLLTAVAVQKSDMLLLDSRPVDHSFVKLDPDDERSTIPLDDDEAALVREGCMTVIRMNN